jgi:glycerol-3-phosphate acyltransferase PlsY
MINLTIIFIISYLLGSLSPSIVVGKILKNIDIREHGSKNAGGTNVYRVLGLWPALLVVLIDVSKGFIACRYISLIRINSNPIPMDQDYLMILAGLLAVLGHICTIFHNFKGGKGIATILGILLGLYPLSMLFSLITFLIIFKITRIVAIGTVLAIGLIPLNLFLLNSYTELKISPVFFKFSFILFPLVVFTHRGNIKRIISGKENKF